MNREVHARFWERSEVKFLRATRPSRHPTHGSERDKAIARFCEVVADYGLPTPIDFQTEFDGAKRADTSMPAHSDNSTSGVFGGK